MFSYAFYFQLLDAWARRFEIHPLADFDGSERPRLYLRHDVDICLKAAAKMAEREAEHGISSTYMFIPTSPLYQLSKQCLMPFIELGHEVAIHFDYRTSGIEPDNIRPAVEAQCESISNLSGQPVRSISFHRPIAQYLHGADELYGLVNAYSATLMACYRSDSAGRWRSDPLDVPQCNVAQLLTHPIWWNDRHQEPGECLKSFYLDRGGGAELDRLILETAPGVRRAI